MNNFVESLRIVQVRHMTSLGNYRKLRSGESLAIEVGWRLGGHGVVAVLMQPA
ncbi:hypothetical protein ACFLTY_03170 [Chloroflexota bacterium]